METITRKTLLYKTGVEYGDYTMNHVFGCAHGCLYPCYAYALALISESGVLSSATLMLLTKDVQISLSMPVLTER